MDLNVPTRFGRYDVESKLGNGAFGTVYKAWDSHLETHVALKIPHIEGISDERRQHILARFHREAKAAARLPPHSNICPIRDHGEIEGQPYVALAFLNGRPLSKVRKPQPIPTALRTVRRIARAMQVAHDHAVIHRDLKPDNIMIVEGDQPVVMDFGLARRLDSEESLQTADGTVMGTPAYMSPEQASGKQAEIGPQCDIYSLGVIGYELLTGRRPFDADSILGLLTKIATATPAPPSQINPEIDAALDAICLKAIARDRDIRYASMRELDDALADYSNASRGRKRRTTSKLQRDSVLTQPLPTADLTPAEMFSEREEQTESGEEIQSLQFVPILTDEDRDPPTHTQASLSASGSETIAIRLDSTERVPRRPRPEKSPWKDPKLIMISGGALLLLLAAIVFLFQTKQGTIRVEIHDPEIEVAVKGTEIVLQHADKDKTIKLTPGEKTLIVQRGDFTFETDTLILKKGETITVRVELLAGQIEVHQGDKRIGQKLLSEPTRPSKPERPALLIAPFDSDTARNRQEAWAKFLNIPNFVQTNSIGINMVLIPPGEFIMGSPANEMGRIDNEFQHRVRITQPFYLGQHEVTVGQFAAFVKDMGYKTEAETDGQGGRGWNLTPGLNEDPSPKYNWKKTGFLQDDSHPVVNVTHYDAQKFCEWLSQQEGVMYRLPTEAEWEYACRAGTNTLYYHGDDPEGLPAVGNVADGTAKAKFSDLNTIAAEDGFIFTAPVGRFRANAFHLYDMHGNVWEWCADYYADDYYINSLVEDPQGPIKTARLVSRGGSWGRHGLDGRSAFRGHNYHDNRSSSLGFRVARVQVR